MSLSTGASTASQGVSLRLGNVYGPRQDPRGEAGVVAIFCGRLAEGARPTIFGDGRQTRDFLYVGDVVEALISAADRLAAGDELGDVYNVGTGRETSVLELAERLGSLGGGGGFEPEMEPAREGEIQRCAIDSRQCGDRPRLARPDKPGRGSEDHAGTRVKAAIFLACRTFCLRVVVHIP